MMKVAFIDFDGTLSKGYISMEFLDYLFERKIYPLAVYSKQMKILKKYQAGKLSYDDWCYQWGILWGNGLNGRKVKEIEDCAKNFFKTFKPNIYPSSWELVKILKEKKYHPLVISVGAYEVVSLAAATLGINEVHSTKISSRNGFYRAEVATNLHGPTGKHDLMEQLILSGKYDFSNSIAFGDSIHDVSILKRVKIPVALNPSEEMLSFARQNNWLTLDHTNVVDAIKDLL